MNGQTPVDINARDRWRNTPLSDAINNGNKAAAQWLRVRGGTTFNRQSAAALCWAARDGDSARLRRLLNRGYDGSVADYDGRTALMVAASEGHEDVVRLLLGMGVPTNTRDRNGNTAADEARSGLERARNQSDSSTSTAYARILQVLQN
eukprot:SAG31_NODE_4579_length_3121_cov_1.314692_4_plen_149_part_00